MRLKNKSIMENNIEVAARIRPPIHSNHLSEDVCLYANPYAKEIVLANQMSFYVDYALPLEINQSQLFDTIISQRIDYMLQGYDVSFIAYGHVNSGKTYTMLGPGLHCALSETTYGILPRSGRDIFNRLLAFRQRFGLQFKVSVSFIEICNEEAKDLLSSYSTPYPNGSIGFKTNEKGFTAIYGVEEVECHNASELFNCLRVGMSYRKSARTNLNSLSSLSHCIVIIKVEQKWFSNEGRLETITSQAMFVDLAGSEQMFLMSPIDSDRVHQAAVGNMGLGVISAIIASFSGQWLPSSPFTQSLLFPLLKDSFIGSIKTLLVCCLSPSSSDYSETLNSLRLIDHIHTLNKYSLLKDTITFNMNNSDSYQIVNDPEETRRDGFAKNSSGLEFAASQWLKLVSNAEDLFNKLVNVDNTMPEEAREEIEEWLCLKQECEECFSVEKRTVTNNNNNRKNNNNNSNEMHNGVRSLEIIEEVTESDTKSKSDKSSENRDSLSSDVSSDSSDSNTDVEQDDRNFDNYHEIADIENNNSPHLQEPIFEQESLCNNSCRDDFEVKLNLLMEKFMLRTDEKVDNVVNINAADKEVFERERNNELKNIVLPKPNRCNIGRRQSILPCSNQILFRNLSFDQKRDSEESVDETESKNEVQIIDSAQNYPVENNFDKSGEIKCDSFVNSEVIDCDNSSSKQGDVVTHEKAFQIVPNNNVKHLGLTNLDLEAATKRIDKLQSMIKIKEQFIEEMIRNSGTRISAKAKFQRKYARLEEEYHKVKVELAKAEEALSHEVIGDASVKGEVERCKNLVSQYERRLRDIEVIKQIAGDSAKKVLELENSLHNSKRKMQKLRKQLKKEEDHKHSLESELINEDQKKIKVLDRYEMESGKLKNSALNDNMRLELFSIQDTKSETPENQTLLKKQDLKKELTPKKTTSKNLLQVSARISHLEQILNDRSTDLEEGCLDNKEALRHEIRNLRKTRDCLLEERRNLDAKLNKDKVLTIAEERKFIECDEAIEAIDATIEYKNELICGRKGLISIIENGQHEKCEEMLLLRLLKLSTVEMRILLYKYFQKVVDLRENGRRMESQIIELDRHAETQSWKIQALSNALQQAHLESERRLIAAQKEHQEKLHLIFRHFADETSGHSSGADDTEKCRRQNKALKQRVLELEAMLYKVRNSECPRTEVAGTSTSPQELQPAHPTSRLNIPQHNLRQLGGVLIQHTTKVTRQKNKLIIQQQKTDKKPPK